MRVIDHPIYYHTQSEMGGSESTESTRDHLMDVQNKAYDDRRESKKELEAACAAQYEDLREFFVQQPYGRPFVDPEATGEKAALARVCAHFAGGEMDTMLTTDDVRDGAAKMDAYTARLKGLGE